MQTVVGIFLADAKLEETLTHLRRVGVTSNDINILLPGAAQRNDAPVSDAEAPGVATAIGAVVGGAAGAFAGLSVAATLLIPGIGTVAAVGLLAAAALGAVGAVGGGVLGAALEQTLDEGLPVDEIYLYEDALRKGRVVLMVQADSEPHAAVIKSILEQGGAESIDAAREQWWIGLRSAEEAEYHAAKGKGFIENEPDFRRGFEMSQLPGMRDKSYSEALPILRVRYPKICEGEAFRHGYERGRLHREHLAGSRSMMRSA